MKKKLLDSIVLPEGIKKLTFSELSQISEEIRENIIGEVSKTGGHLASNLGAVELTVSLHKVFSSPQDTFVWDVGHQCYAHKILTGRSIKGIRTKDGVSGFPKPNESVHDSFVAGHASNSVSAALGIATAKHIQNNAGETIAIVGDGAFSGGMIYEAMNNAGRSNLPLIVVLNDNEMSISKNVGAMAKYLANIRSKEGYFNFKDKLEKNILKIPAAGKQVRDTIAKLKVAVKDNLYGSNFFENFGFYYLGPVNGHDIPTLCRVFERAKKLNRPVLVHVNTVKGKGYTPSEKNPSAFHGIAPFDPKTGKLISESKNGFSEQFGDILTDLAKEDKSICAITAAMKDGTGLNKFSHEYPDRFFDVGIAEEHALTFASGLAAGGAKPVFAVYSTFLQRCYDQLIHDASIHPRHIILGIDRAGIVGGDGETHQGVFDIPMLTSVPGATIYCPSTYIELKLALTEALCGSGICAVRYPRGGEPLLPDVIGTNYSDYSFFEKKKAKTLVICYGRLFANVIEATKNQNVSILKLNKVFPLTEEEVTIATKHKNIYFFEESIKEGSIAEHFGTKLREKGYKGSYEIHAISGYIPHMTVIEAMEMFGFDTKSISEVVTKEETDIGK